MGPSSSEIEREIAETRRHVDANLSVLEGRATSTAKRAARVAAVIASGLAVAAAASFVVYRLRRRRSPIARARNAAPRTIRRLPHRFVRALRRPLPTVKVVVADPEEEGRVDSPWRSTAQKVATAVAVAAAGGVTSRILKPRASRGRDGR